MSETEPSASAETRAMARETEQALLEVKDLRVYFRTGVENVHAVNGVDLSVHAGESTAVLGESGSGKSVTAAAIMRLIQSPPAVFAGGRIQFKGQDVLGMDLATWRRSCGPEIALIFQDALASLNPVFSVGWQIAELFRTHQRLPAREAGRRAVELLEKVGIPEPGKRAGDYPHQFSGGMRQRVMIAMAIALGPDLLIADEPTTALDVTVQAQIMDLLKALREETGMAMMLITHDLGVVADVAETVHIMYAGQVVESGTVEAVLSRPAHPYTLALLQSVPQAVEKGSKLSPIPGSPPDLAHLPTGCAFHPRCQYAVDQCRQAAPARTEISANRVSRCHRAREVFGG
jgi:oligopeptide transport system ATP-binding protein